MRHWRGKDFDLDFLNGPLFENMVNKITLCCFKIVLDDAIG